MVSSRRSFLGSALALSVVSTTNALLQNPVSEVISVLEKMNSQLTGEQAQDDQLKEKMKTWCSTTDQETKDKIEAAKNEIAQLRASISSKTGKMGSLTTEVGQLTKDIAKETESLALATKLREQTLAKFNAEEKEMLESISALQAAITVLKKHNSLMQLPANVESSLMKILDGSADQKRFHAVNSILTSYQRKKLTSVLQQPTFNDYSSQSGEIFGILGTMLDTFKADLESARGDEMADMASFSETKEKREESIAMMTRYKTEKTVELETTTAEKAADEASLITTEESLDKDQKFLANMSLDCQDFEQEFEARNTERVEELKVVNMALTYLQSDEASQLFGNTFGGSGGSVFAQVRMLSSGAKNSSVQQQKVVSLLERGAANFNNPQLTALAQDVKLSRFEKVLQAIDNMVEDLKSQLVEDKTTKDNCVKELNKYSADITSTTRDLGDLSAKKASLDKKIELLTNEMEELDNSIAETNAALDEASATRQQENTVFQESIANATGSIEVLTKALTVLQSVYKVNPNPAFLQQNSGKKQSPEGFQDYQKSTGGQKVLSLIEQIVADATKAKELTTAAEEEAQRDYETMVKDTNETLKAYKKSRASKKDMRASKSEELGNTVADMSATNTTLVSLTEGRASRAESCQFLMNNFDLRQAHMKSEITALQEAKAYINNMV